MTIKLLSQSASGGRPHGALGGAGPTTFFEGFEDAGRPAGRDYASALLWDARGQIQPVLEECDGDIRCDMPKDVQHTLTFFNGVAPQAPKPKAKKKARAKKAKAADEPTAD